MSDVDDILDRGEDISRQEMRSETAGGGRSTEYAKFRKVALDLEPGGEGKKYPKLTESQVSSIRTQVNHLNPEDAEDDEEKEFIATRRKMKTEGGEDITNDEGEQLYTLYLRRDEVDGQDDASPENEKNSQ